MIKRESLSLRKNADSLKKPSSPRIQIVLGCLFRRQKQMLYVKMELLETKNFKKRFDSLLMSSKFRIKNMKEN